MTSTLSILKNVTTPLKRCINEVIILIPLSDTNVVNLNGTVHNIQTGLIINNCDLYQYLNVTDLIELKISLTLFLERDISLVNSYFDFDLISDPKMLYNIVNRHLYASYSNTTITTSDIASIVSILLKEAKQILTQQYLPTYHTKHKLLNDILAYINTHLSDTIHTKSVAQYFYISQSYISILFSNVMHMHFKNYIISLKIALSLHDLLSPNESIQSVARKYNFMNLSTFTKHFKTYLNVPPKVYVHQFHKQLSICQSTLTINTIEHDYNDLLINNQHNSATPLTYTLDLDDSRKSRYLPIPKTLIKVKDISALSKLIHIQDDCFNLTHFSKPHIYIQQLKENDLTHFNVKLLLAIMPKIISKGCYLILPIRSKAFYQLLNQRLLQIIEDKCAYHLFFKHIKLIIHEDCNWSAKQLSSLKRLINSHYPSVDLGVLLDPYINHSSCTSSSLVDYINNLNMEFYIINLSLSTLVYKLAQTTDKLSAHEMLLSFIQSLAYYAKKIIFTHITTDDINLYLKSYTDITSVKIMQFLIEFAQRIGGFGFPLLSDINNDIALLSNHITSLTLVHIYSMLLPFMGKTVQQHDFG